jgi:hypothetical protein
MALAHWVRDLDDYAKWIRDVIDRSGGELVRPQTGNPSFEDTPVLEVGGVECFGFVVEDHRVVFYDPAPHVLDFFFDVTLTPDGFEYGEYGYNFRRADGLRVWRYDRHPGHPEVGETHMHSGPNERLCPSVEVDLDDVMDMVRQHLASTEA